MRYRLLWVSSNQIKAKQDVYRCHSRRRRAVGGKSYSVNLSEQRSLGRTIRAVVVFVTLASLVHQRASETNEWGDENALDGSDHHSGAGSHRGSTDVAIQLGMGLLSERWARHRRARRARSTPDRTVVRRR